MTHHHHHHARPSPYEIAQLAEFDHSIADDPPDEQARKRVLYLRDADARLQSFKAMLPFMGCFLIPFIIIPIFWPILLVMYFIINSQRKVLRRQRDQALEYWNLREWQVAEGA